MEENNSSEEKIIENNLETNKKPKQENIENNGLNINIEKEKEKNDLNINDINIEKEKEKNDLNINDINIEKEKEKNDLNINDINIDKEKEENNLNINNINIEKEKEENNLNINNINIDKEKEENNLNINNINIEKEKEENNLNINNINIEKEKEENNLNINNINIEKKEEENDLNINNINIEKEKEENNLNINNINIDKEKEEINLNINIEKEKEQKVEKIDENNLNINNINIEKEKKEKNEENNLNINHLIIEKEEEKEIKEENIKINYSQEKLNKNNNNQEIDNKINEKQIKEVKEEKINDVNGVKEIQKQNNIIQEEVNIINNIEKEPKNNNIKQEKINLINNIIEEQKNNNDIFGDFVSVEKQENKSKEKKAKREECNLKGPELNKLKEVFLNSFTLQSKSEKDEKKEKADKETENNFLILENDTHYNPELFNDKNNQKKKKVYDDIIKFKDELSLKKKLKKFRLFYYQSKNPSDDKSIYKLGKVLVYTYRKNFPKIKNYKNNKTYTTDAWWGCMVRCGQMILSRGIYRLLKSKGLFTKEALFYTVPLFGNYPIRTQNLHKYFQGMITKYKDMVNLDESSDKDIKEFYPPFSIKTLCDVGEIFERTAGEWFSDVIITGVFRKISEYFNLFNHKDLNVKIMTFQSCIEMKDILEECFVQQKYDKKNQNYIHFQKKYYYYNKMGIIFVNVRVGLDKIPKDYYEGIRQLFRLKECIGIIGGKTRLAYYFIGYNEDDDSLLYLDPHVTKEADKVINMGNILSKHVNKEIHLLKLNKMSTAFTIGFCFRTYEEFLDLYEFWNKAKQDKLPILGMVKQSIEYDGKDLFDEDDCSPTYEDKDEDDF